MDLSKEEIHRIQMECFGVLASRGVRPDGNIIRIKRGSLGIRLLGKVDFLSQTGFWIYWV